MSLEGGRDKMRSNWMNLGKSGLPLSSALVPQPCVCTSDRVGQPILEMEALP